MPDYGSALSQCALAVRRAAAQSGEGVWAAARQPAAQPRWTPWWCAGARGGSAG